MCIRDSNKLIRRYDSHEKPSQLKRHALFVALIIWTGSLAHRTYSGIRASYDTHVRVAPPHPYFKGGGGAHQHAPRPRNEWESLNNTSVAPKIRAGDPNIECFIRYVDTRSIWLISYLYKVSFLIPVLIIRARDTNIEYFIHTRSIWWLFVRTYYVCFSFSPLFSVWVDSTWICFILFFLFECLPLNLGRNSYHMHVRYDEYVD